MLLNEEMFKSVEEELNKQGIIERFEKEQGQIIKGHLMITLIDVPEGILSNADSTENLFGFCGTYDFYDMAICIALHTDTMKVEGDLWFLPQTKDAEEPAREWIDFFVEVLCDSISEDGSFGCPIYTFIADVGHFSVVPTLNPENVLHNTVEKMTDVQKEFICKEAGITIDGLRQASEDKLGEIYDMLCDIENEETIDDSELSERGKLAEGLVTLMGNAIAESEGWLDEYYDEEDKEDEE